MFVIPCRYTGEFTPEEIKKSYVLKSVTPKVNFFLISKKR